jgi:hypothetical protein
VRQGAAGVEYAAQQLEAMGARVLGREVTFSAGGRRVRADMVIELPNQDLVLVEVKTGLTAKLSRNQVEGYAAIRLGGAIPRGNNAASAGLDVGTPLGPTQVMEWFQPWPLN